MKRDTVTQPMRLISRKKTSNISLRQKIGPANLNLSAESPVFRSEFKSTNFDFVRRESRE